MKKFLGYAAELLMVSALGCGGNSKAPHSPAPSAAESASAAERSQSKSEDGTTDAARLPSSQATRVSDILAQVLSERELNGAIAVYDSTHGQLLCSAEDACTVPLGPASTFKIPHTLIGLELGELESAEHPFKWDGQQYSVAAWNQDHLLRSAMEVSCVPCFQQLARRIGEERMTAALRKLDYGNATLGGPIDMFWLQGGLQISAVQQLDFLYKLQSRALPFRPEVMETTIDIIPKTAGEGTILRGKTGMLGSDPPVGWYVGWLEWENGPTYFATALHGENDREKLPEARRAVTVEALRRLTKIQALK